MTRLGIIDRLQAGEVLVMDGATGSELQRRGVDVNKGSVEGKLGVWSAAANLDAPEVVQAIHEDYLNAGAEIIISNNFYTSRIMMNVIGKQEHVDPSHRISFARQRLDLLTDVYSEGFGLQTTDGQQ